MAITASFLYCKAKENMLGRATLTTGESARLSLSTSIFAALILESCTPDQNASTTGSYRSVFASRINNAASATALADAALATMEISSSNGITYFDAGDAVFVSVSTGQIIGGILIYQRQANDSDSLPIALIDINVVTSNGASINVNWDNGVNRIFALTG